jgi:hypothetical protein
VVPLVTVVQIQAHKQAHYETINSVKSWQATHCLSSSLDWQFVPLCHVCAGGAFKGSLKGGAAAGAALQRAVDDESITMLLTTRGCLCNM